MLPFQGLDAKYSASLRPNTETLTIAAGNVNPDHRTTADGQSPAVNDYVLIMNAPASTGAGRWHNAFHAACNGLLPGHQRHHELDPVRVLPICRAPNSPWGAYSFRVWLALRGGGGGFVITTPATSAAFTYGTNNIAFTQFTGAGEINC